VRVSARHNFVTGFLAFVVGTGAGAAEICTCGFECDVVLSTNLSGVDSRTACNTIVTAGDVAVESGAFADLLAGKSVMLDNGFSVLDHAELVVSIDPLLSCQLDVDADRDGVSECFDCDDQDKDVYPGASEICDGADNDCNPVTEDGADDPQLGAACDGPDSDLCLEGVLSCGGGSLVCDDATGTTVETCDGSGQDEDCDGQVDEGFDRNDNPLCTAGFTNLGAISGDTGTGVLTDLWYNEEWDRFILTEDNFQQAVYLSATVQLYSPPGVDFDLYVYCVTCGGTLAGSSANRGLDGHYDLVNVRKDDVFGVDDTLSLVVEVRHFTSNLCARWSLTITGNTVVNSPTCG